MATLSCIYHIQMHISIDEHTDAAFACDVLCVMLWTKKAAADKLVSQINVHSCYEKSVDLSLIHI